MSDVEKEEITEENRRFAVLLESTAYIVHETAKKLSERVNSIAEALAGEGELKLPAPPNFVFNVGTLTGELDQVVHTMKGYLSAYSKFRDVYLINVLHKKEEMH